MKYSRNNSKTLYGMIILSVLFVLNQAHYSQSISRISSTGESVHLNQSSALRQFNSTVAPSMLTSSTRTLGFNQFESMKWSVESGVAGKRYSLYETRILLASLVKPKIEPVLVIKTGENETDSKSEGNESFFKSDLFYFIGAAALATTFYFIWDNNDKTVSKKTFGTPPKP